MHNVTKFLVVIGVVGAGVCAAIPFRRVEPIAVQAEVPAAIGADAHPSLGTRSGGEADSPTPDPVALNVSGLSADAPPFSIADREQEAGAIDGIPRLAGNPAIKAERPRHDEFRKFEPPAPPPDLPPQFGDLPKPSSKPATDGDKTVAISSTPSNPKRGRATTVENNADDDRKGAFRSQSAGVATTLAEDGVVEAEAEADEPPADVPDSQPQLAETGSNKKPSVERTSGDDPATEEIKPAKSEVKASEVEDMTAQQPPGNKPVVNDDASRQLAVAENAVTESVVEKPERETSTVDRMVAGKPRAKKQRKGRDNPGSGNRESAEAESVLGDALPKNEPVSGEVRRLALPNEASRTDETGDATDSMAKPETQEPMPESEAEETDASAENPGAVAEPSRHAVAEPNEGAPQTRPPVVSIPSDPDVASGWRGSAAIETPPPAAVEYPPATPRIAIRSDWRATGGAQSPAATGDSATAPRTPPPVLSTNGLAAGQPQSVRHRVRDGDSLAGLAQQYLGNRARYLEIFHANRHVLVSPDILPIGVELIVPTSPDAIAPGSASIHGVNGRAGGADSVQAPLQPRLVPIPPDAFSRRYR